MNWGLLGSVVLAGFVAWYIVVPLWVADSIGGGSGVSHDPVESLTDQQARCLQVLRDLELDHTTGKISSADYEQTKTRLSIELASILERLDALPRR